MLFRKNGEKSARHTEKSAFPGWKPKQRGGMGLTEPLSLPGMGIA